MAPVTRATLAWLAAGAAAAVPIAGAAAAVPIPPGPGSAELSQLRQRDHTALAGSDPGQGRVAGCARFSIHAVTVQVGRSSR
jgi:hypothetical protein